MTRTRIPVLFYPNPKDCVGLRRERLPFEKLCEKELRIRRAMSRRVSTKPKAIRRALRNDIKRMIERRKEAASA